MRKAALPPDLVYSQCIAVSEKIFSQWFRPFQKVIFSCIFVFLDYTHLHLDFFNRGLW